MSRRLRLSLAFGLVSLMAARPGFLPPILGGTPMVTLMPSSLHFGKQVQGTSSAPQSVLVTKSGNADLVITGIDVGGTNATDFAQTNDRPVAPASLAAGASCTLLVVFKPSGAGEETAVLSISDNAPGSPHTIPLSGTGTPPVPIVKLTPAHLNFGNQTVGTTSAAQTIILANTGSATLNITRNVIVSGQNSTEFALVMARTTCPVTGGQLPGAASGVIAISFVPATLGAKSAQVIMVNDAEGSPHAVPLAGTAVPK